MKGLDLIELGLEENTIDVEIPFDRLECLGPIQEYYQYLVDRIVYGNSESKDHYSQCVEMIEDFQRIHGCWELTDKLWEIMMLKFKFGDCWKEDYEEFKRRIKEMHKEWKSGKMMRDLLENSEDLDPEIVEMVNENFWKLIGNDEEISEN